jgi:hypothetical protein
MNGKVVGGVLVALVLLGMCAMACVLPLGASLFMTRGMRGDVQYVPVVPNVPDVPAVPSVPQVAYGSRMMHFGPFGMGLGLLTCLIPLGLLFLGFALLRRGFWHRHWGPPGGPGGPGGHAGPFGHGVPPAFDEWHRQAHAGQPPQPPQPGPEAR